MSSNGYVPPKTLPGKFDAILPTGVLLRANKTNVCAWHIRERRYLPTYDHLIYTVKRYRLNNFSSCVGDRSEVTPYRGCL